MSPPQCACEHSKRIEVYLTRLGSTNNLNRIWILFHHLNFMFLKRVSRMVIGEYPLQCWTWTRILPVSCGRVHHKGSLNSTRFVLICKLCLVTHLWPPNYMKFVSKIIKNYIIISIFFLSHVKSEYPHDLNVYPSPFHQYEAALNTICCRMKSWSRVEVYWPIVKCVQQELFWTSSCIVLRRTTCWCVPACQFKYKCRSDRGCGDLMRSPT